MKDLKINTTLNLTPDRLKELITLGLKCLGYETKLEDISFNVGRESRGWGSMDHDVPVFRGCDVKTTVYFSCEPYSVKIDDDKEKENLRKVGLKLGLLNADIMRDRKVVTAVFDSQEE